MSRPASAVTGLIVCLTVTISLARFGCVPAAAEVFGMVAYVVTYALCSR